MNAQHDERTSNLPVEVWSRLWSEALRTNGRSDAFAFALKCDGDLPQLQREIQEIEEMMSDPRMQTGPMAPGHGPRIYREAYLEGLREALGVIADAAAQEKRAVGYKG